MIEISHAQARRWVRQSLDRPISEGQWSALQGHLENCAECRAYRAERVELEKNLRRDLRVGWMLAELPPDLPQRMLMELRARSNRRRGMTRAALALGVLAVIVGLLWNASVPREEAAPEVSALVEATPTAAPSPTPRYEGDFRGVLAFEAPALDGKPLSAGQQNGQRPPADVFLLALNTGSAELTNMTNHPAADYAPAWSPDGNWLAFLSERDRQQGADIYLISVAGSGLTRLTSDEQLSWSGPLAWSPDGNWIAAAAQEVAAQEVEAGSQPEAAQEVAAGSPAESSGQRAEQQIYRIAPDGSHLPEALPDTQGGYAPRFAPNRPILAFITQEGELIFLRAYHEPSHQTRDLTRTSAQVHTAAGLVTLGVTAFDWSADGSQVLYVSRPLDPITEPSSTLVRVVDVVDFEPPSSSYLGEGIPGVTRASRVLATFPGISPVVSATLSPNGQLLFSRSYRRFGQGPRCRPLATPPEMISSSEHDFERASLALPVLCLESGIERASWTTDGRWIVVGASAASDSEPAFYALSLPARGSDSRVARSERLADLPAGAGTPRVRPSGVLFEPVSKADWLVKYVLAGR